MGSRSMMIQRMGALLMACAGLVLTAHLGRADDAAAAGPPKVGDMAKDFKLMSIDGKVVTLEELHSSGPVALLVLRGYPGYQCPICSLQVGDYVAKAKRFGDAKVNVVLIYPGAADGLKTHADEFIRGRTLPDNVYLLLDPDYDFVESYGLRWNAPSETAYPSTFVIDSNGVVRFAKISMSHGDRTRASDVLKIIETKP